jgi:hypothetical protein
MGVERRNKYCDRSAKGKKMNNKVMKTGYLTAQQVHDFEVLLPLLKAMYVEFQELSKKKPQEVVTPSKVKVANRVLTPVLALLETEPSRPFLDPLDSDDLPQNSDAVLMLGQAVTAMQSFRGKYYSGSSGWRIDPTDD